jgi:hypothetical protein
LERPGPQLAALDGRVGGAAVANGTDQAPVPLHGRRSAPAIPPAAFIGLMSTWAAPRAGRRRRGRTRRDGPHPAVVGVPLALISLGVAIAAYQRILADWRT